MQTLQGQVGVWLASKPYGVFGEYEPGPPEEYIFRIRFFQDTPQTWGLLVGDFAHNARSALDHLAWQVVTAGGGSPDERTQFPIVLQEEDWLSQVTRLAGASAEHIALIEGQQPYHRLDLLGHQTFFSAMAHPLAVLNFLNNEDKHRVLNTTPASFRSLGYSLEVVSGMEEIGLVSGGVQFGPLEDGAPLVSVPIVATGPDPKMQLHRESEAVEITFSQRAKSGTEEFERRGELFETLGAILDEVQKLLDLFVAEFR